MPNYSRPYFSIDDVQEFRRLCKLYKKKPVDMFRHLLDMEKHFREEIPKEIEAKRKDKLIFAFGEAVKAKNPAEYHKIVSEVM